ncbi:hypothetical protein BKI52_35780 [marine bacterium AO1-C]|nr:hypothetical protein BKI52_35780 [marine bacterium AO1-C]
MKPQLETVQISDTQTSFKFFKREELVFEPYWHYHPEIELTFISQGRGTRMVGDSIESFQAGDLVLMGENLPHNYSTTDLNLPYTTCTAYVFQFNQAIFEAFPECKPFQALFSKASYGLKYLAPPAELLEQIKSFEQLSSLQQLVRLLNILDYLKDDTHYRQLSGITYQKNVHKHQNRVAKITQYILERVESPLSLGEISQFAGMTPNAFCSWFKKSLGFTFITYLNTLRVEKACHYLLETDWDISEIAFKVGYENITHFNRVFKNIKNTTPKVYRKNFYNN